MADGLVGDSTAVRQAQTIRLLQTRDPHVWARVDPLAWEAGQLKTKKGKLPGLTYSASRWHKDAAAEQPPSRAW